MRRPVVTFRWVRRAWTLSHTLRKARQAVDDSALGAASLPRWPPYADRIAIQTSYQRCRPGPRARNVRPPLRFY